MRVSCLVVGKGRPTCALGPPAAAGVLTRRQPFDLRASGRQKNNTWRRRVQGSATATLRQLFLAASTLSTSPAPGQRGSSDSAAPEGWPQARRETARSGDRCDNGRRGGARRHPSREHNRTTWHRAAPTEPAPVETSHLAISLCRIDSQTAAGATGLGLQNRAQCSRQSYGSEDTTNLFTLAARSRMTCLDDQKSVLAVI